MIYVYAPDMHDMLSNLLQLLYKPPSATTTINHLLFSHYLSAPASLSTHADLDIGSLKLSKLLIFTACTINPSRNKPSFYLLAVKILD